MDKLRAAILGATGREGQEFIEALYEHPLFELTTLAASERSEGKLYGDACKWLLDNDEIREFAAKERVINASHVDLSGSDIIFSALPTDKPEDKEYTQKIEAEYAKKLPVFSITSAHRYDEDVPIIIPEVNAEHYKLIEAQRKNKDFKGFIVTGPNCTTVGQAISLAPVYTGSNLRLVVMTSMQAISGGGQRLIELRDRQEANNFVEGEVILKRNVVPYIPNEEEKVRRETLKILGKYDRGTSKIIDAGFQVEPSCNRVDTKDGHLESMTVFFNSNYSPEDFVEAIDIFNRRSGQAFGNLYSAPKETIHVFGDPYRPQPLLDAKLGNGMTTSIGRIRHGDTKNCIKYTVLSNNSVKSGSGGEVMVAELFHREGYLFH